MSASAPSLAAAPRPVATAVTLHIISCEFPPKPGGVSDYTFLLAEQLAAAGDTIHVWCPESRDPETGAFTVHPELGRKSPLDLLRLDRSLNVFPSPRRLLIQWVPHGYGYKSVNLWFPLWVWKRSRVNGDSVELMVHEAFLDFGGRNWLRNLAALAHRFMITSLLAAASKVWLSTSAWESKLRPYTLRQDVPFAWLPIPSNIPVLSAPETVSRIRQRYTPSGGVLLGHFGTYGKDVAHLLYQLIPLLFDEAAAHSLLLLGRGSRHFCATLLNRYPALAGKVHASGLIEAGDVSLHIQACDVMIQPYEDGITTRRTTATVSLAHGRPVVTTLGRSTEPFWLDTHALQLAPVADIPGMAQLIRSLISNAAERRTLGDAARLLYKNRFHSSHTVAAIRSET